MSGSGPQLEDGYTRIANQLLDEILRYPFTKRQLSVLLAVIRKTYGYNKKADDISSRQLARMTGIDQADCARTVRELTRLGVLLKDSGRYGHRLMVNKRYHDWQGRGEGKSPSEEAMVKHHRGDGETPSRVMVNHHGGDGKTPSRCDGKSPSTKDNYQKTTNKRERGDSKTGAHSPGRRGGSDAHAPTPMNRQSFGLQGKADGGQTARNAKTAAKRGTPINGFQMNEEIRAWAREKGITVRLDLEFEKFRDYHQARGTVFKDWNAALRNWLRKAQEFQAPQTPLRTVNGRRYETDRGICPGSAQDQIRQITRQFLREQGEDRDDGGESIEGIRRAVK